MTSGGYGFTRRALDRLRLPAARRADRDARRGRGLRRLDRLRGRARAAVRPGGRADPGMSRASSPRDRRRFGPAWSRPRARAPGGASCAAGSPSRSPPATRPTRSPAPHFRRDLQISTQAGPDVRDPGRHRRSSGRSAAGILAAFPTTASSARSTATEAADAATRWYIDPIDGTHNFIRGVPLFGTLLAVERDGELQAASSPRPRSHERWWALARRRRVGAQPRTSAPRRIRVSGVAPSTTPRSCTARAATSTRPGRAGLPAPCSTPSGGSAASATSGATRCSPRAPPRR